MGWWKAILSLGIKLQVTYATVLLSKNRKNFIKAEISKNKKKLKITLRDFILSYFKRTQTKISIQVGE